MAIGDPYASAAELKTYLGITGAGDDTQLGWAVGSASRMVNEHCRRQFNDSGSATARTFTSWGRCLAVVDDFSTLTGLVVATGSTGSYSTTLTVDVDFVAEPLGGVDGDTEMPLSATAAQAGAYWRLRSINGSIYPVLSPVTEANVSVTARWGWSAVPDTVKQATLIQATRLYKRASSPEGVLGGFEMGAVRVGSKLDPDVAMTLAHLVKHKRGMFV